jgi:hypothetical protein
MSKDGWSSEFVASILANPFARKLVKIETLEKILEARNVPPFVVIVFDERKCRERHRTCRLSSRHSRSV